MTFRHRRGLIAATLALGAAALGLVPALASAAPTRQVVAEEPVRAVSREDATDALFSGNGRRLVVADDGTLQLFEDRDFTSEDSTRRLTGATALADRPERFDLRNATVNGATGNFVTSVKRQNPFGACWAFAATSAAETSILSEYGSPVTDGTDPIDFSEKQIAWFAVQPLPASVDPDQAGEGIHTDLDAATDSGSFYNLGGNFYDSTMLFSSMMGPTEESLDPALEYHNAADQYEDDLQYAQPSAEGDWSVPEELRRVASVELEQSFSLPSPASWEPIEDSAFSRYVFNQQGVDAIKDQLLAGRGVSVGFCADGSVPGDLEEPNYINVDTRAQYTYENPMEGAEGGAPNHAVAIVGWDDTYSRDNFNADHRPPGDGAFIVKNNWGSLDSSYGNRNDWGIDGSGYFYLSYYDKGIQLLESYDFITPNDDDLTYGTGGDGQELDQYQHAYLAQVPSSTYFDGVVSSANIYEMSEPSLVRNVSIETYSYDTDVRFDLYRLRKGATEPSDGELVWSHDASFQFGGYHRVELDEPVLVEAGDRLGVVATVTLPDGRTEIPQNTDTGEAMSRVMNPDRTTLQWSETVVNPGESFYGSPTKRVEYSDGSYAYEGYEWTDYGEQNALENEIAQSIVDDSDFARLLKARDDAYAAYLAASEGDDEDEWIAYENAENQLSQLVESLPDEATSAFYVWDNFPINLSAEAYDAENPPVAGTVEMLRLYNPASGEHLYTSDAHEANVLTSQNGWKLEGSEWTAPARSNTAVYRLFNQYTGEHFYTASRPERATLLDAGWSDEGVGFHSDNRHATPVYRLANPYDDGVGAHLFTTSATERDACVQAGWRNEGIAWYGV